MTSDVEFRATRHVYIACVIDILGQSERLNAWNRTTGWPGGEENHDEFMTLQERCLAPMRELRERFFSDWLALHNAHLDKAKAIVDGIARERAVEHLKLALHVDQMSDMFVVSSPLFTASDEESLEPIMRMITCAGYLMMWGLASGYPVRGGIAAGVGVRTKSADGEAFHGYALSRAYELESKCAGHPRVVVDDVIVERLKRLDLLHDSQVNAQSFKGAKMLQELLARDFDGRWQVDYLRFWTYRRHRDGEVDRLQRCQRYVREMLRWADAHGNLKLLERYRRVAGYFESAGHPI